MSPSSNFERLISYRSSSSSSGFPPFIFLLASYLAILSFSLALYALFLDYLTSRSFLRSNTNYSVSSSFSCLIFFLRSNFFFSRYCFSTYFCSTSSFSIYSSSCFYSYILCGTLSGSSFLSRSISFLFFYCLSFLASTLLCSCSFSSYLASTSAIFSASCSAFAACVCLYC